MKGPQGGLLRSRLANGRQLSAVARFSTTLIAQNLCSYAARPLCPTGVEGPFRRGCERALAALRANAGPLATLLELALTDPGVDWEAEGGAKAASKVGLGLGAVKWSTASVVLLQSPLRACRELCAENSKAPTLTPPLRPSLPAAPPALQAFAHAAALQTFVLRQASTGQALAAAVRAAAAGLAAAAASLGPYAHQFLAAASTAAAAAESHARLQRCQATLDNAAAQEQQLAARVQEGQAALEAMLAESQPLAVELQACLQECQVGCGRGAQPCLPSSLGCLVCCRGGWQQSRVACCHLHI